MSKTLSEEIDFALCCISECCVDESKRNITSRKAVEQIREYLNVLNDDRYSKNFNVNLKREIREKDARITELEKEKQKAVEEYKDKLIKDIAETIRQQCILGIYNEMFIAGEKQILDFIKGGE